MRTSSSRLRKACLRTGGLFLLIIFISCSGPAGDPAPPPEDLPGFFIQNAGQIDNPDVVLYHASGSMVAGFGPGGVIMKMVEPASLEGTDPVGDRAVQSQEAETVRGVAIGVRFLRSNPAVPEGRGKLPFPVHFLIGSDPSGWQRDVPSFREVVYRNLYDGIDLVYQIGPGGLKYEFRVGPGADPEEIEVAYDGIESLEIIPSGDLVVRTALGDLRDSAPLSYHSQEAGADLLDLSAPAGLGARREVRSGYVLRSPSSYGFQVDGWDGKSTLVIDPLVYSTHLGGLWNDYTRAIAVDPDGFAYLAGWTVSQDFPTSRGSFDQSYTGSQEAFVVKMRSNGRRIVWATYLGGRGQDDAFSVKVDQAREVHVAGITRSLDFPTTNGTTHRGGRFDAFIAKLSFDGSSLLYSSYLGGESDDFAYSMDIDDSGFAYVAGFTRSLMVPTVPGALQPVHMGGTYDAFVTKVHTGGGGPVYFTYLGGASVDYGWAVAADSAGAAYITGSTLSKDFPVTTGSLDIDYNGAQDAFVAKISPDGTTLVYSTHLGGRGFDRGYSIAVDAFGQAHVSGATRSADFPVTAGSLGEIYGGGTDGFVAKLDPTGAALVYGTYLGGTDRDVVQGIDIDFLGDAFVTGTTVSGDFPVTPGAFDITHNGGEDAFLAHFTIDGGALIESTFIGGGSLDRGYAIATRPDLEQVYAAGETRSTDFPTTNRAHDPQQSGVRDGFIVKFRY